MDTASGTAHRLLMQEVASALHSGSGGAGLADLVIRAGGRPRPADAPAPVVLQGVLASGRLVPVEVHGAAPRHSV